MPLLGAHERLGHKIERIIPGDRFEGAGSLVTRAPHGLQQPFRVMHALGIARDFGADHAGRVAVVLGPMNTADRPLIEDFNVKCAG